MQLRAAVPLIDQRLSTLQLQMGAYSQNVNTHVSQILQNISDIATGRAPLTININLPDRSSYDQPQINSNAIIDNHPAETHSGNPGNLPSLSNAYVLIEQGRKKHSRAME